MPRRNFCIIVGSFLPEQRQKLFLPAVFFAINRESFISPMHNFADFDRCYTLPSRAGAGASVIGVVGAVVRVVVVVRACAAGMSEVR